MSANWFRRSVLGVSHNNERTTSARSDIFSSISSNLNRFWFENNNIFGLRTLVIPTTAGAMDAATINNAVDESGDNNSQQQQQQQDQQPEQQQIIPTLISQPVTLSGLINEKLPSEALALVFDRLSLRDLLKANLICKHWYNVQPIALSRRESLHLVINHPVAINIVIPQFFPILRNTDNIVITGLSARTCQRIIRTFPTLKRIDFTFTPNFVLEDDHNGAGDCVEAMVRELFPGLTHLTALSVSFGGDPTAHSGVHRLPFMHNGILGMVMNVNGRRQAEDRLIVGHHNYLLQALNDGMLPTLRILELDVMQPVVGTHRYQALLRRLQRFVLFHDSATRAPMFSATRDSTLEEPAQEMDFYLGEVLHLVSVIEYYTTVIHTGLTSISVCLTGNTVNQSLIKTLEAITLVNPCLVQNLTIRCTNLGIILRDDDLPLTEVPVRFGIKNLELCFDFSITGHKALKFAYIGWIFSGVRLLLVKYRMTGCTRCGYSNAKDEKELTRVDCVRALLKPFRKWQSVRKIKAICLEDGFEFEQSRDASWVDF